MKMKQETISNTTSNRKLDVTEAPRFTVITFIMQYCLLKFPFVAAFEGTQTPAHFFSICAPVNAINFTQ